MTHQTETEEEMTEFETKSEDILEELPFRYDLRDIFAAAALIGFLARGSNGNITDYAYEAADKMLLSRKKTRG